MRDCLCRRLGMVDKWIDGKMYYVRIESVEVSKEAKKSHKDHKKFDKQKKSDR